MRRIPLLLTLALAALGCSSDFTGPIEDARVLGVIDFHGDAVVIDVPSTAVVGTELTVKVVTFGDGCTRKGETEARAEALAATVEPFDYDVSLILRNPVCASILKSFEHEAVLVFEQPGEATVTVRGRREPAGDTVTYTRTVVVEASED